MTTLPWWVWVGTITLSAVVSVTLTQLLTHLREKVTHQWSVANDQQQLRIQLEADRNRRRIEALESVWSLLAYMTDVESKQTIFSWSKSKAGKERTFYCHFDRLEFFLMEALPGAFYCNHVGLHTPKEIQRVLFEYRGLLANLYFKYRGLIDEGKYARERPIEMTNESTIIEGLNQTYDRLNALIRDEINARHEVMERNAEKLGNR